MTTQEIFERLKQFSTDAVRGDKRLDEYHDAIVSSIAKQLGLTNEQALAITGETVEQEKVEAPLQAIEYEISDGYVGSLGITYKAADAETLDNAIEQAAKRNEISVGEVKQMIQSGQKIAWRNSPNYTYDHSVGYIRQKRTQEKSVNLIRCDCGHSAPRAQVMNASRGTSCVDCYDKMSD